DHIVSFRLQETPGRFAADVLAALAGVIWLALVVRGFGTRQRNIPLAIGQGAQLRTLLITILAVATISFFSLFARSPTGLDPAKADLPEAAQFLTTSYRHEFDSIPFKSGPVLLRYAYSASEVRAGSHLDVTLKWDWDRPTTAHVELIPPLV